MIQFNASSCRERAYVMSPSERLREISRTLQIQKKLDRNEILAALNTLIDIAERLEKLETLCPGRK